MGKSTLLDAVARREIPGLEGVRSLFYVRQEVVGDDRTSLQWVLEADGEREALLKEVKTLEESDSAEAGTRLNEVPEYLTHFPRTIVCRATVRAYFGFRGATLAS